MSRADRKARRARLTWQRDDDARPWLVVPSVLAAAAALVAMWPFTSVIEPGAWSFAVVAMIIVTAATGVLMRWLLRRRQAWQRDLVTAVAQVVTTSAVLTQLVAGDTAILGIIPTESTLVTVRALSGLAVNEVVSGVAPLAATHGLQLVMGIGFAVVAILLDQLVAQRSAVIASLLTGVVGSVPIIVAHGDADVIWFLALGVIVLVLLRFTASQHPESPRSASPAVATTVGVAALAITVAITPVLPVSASTSGTGSGTRVDASLRLGDDLRQPNPVEVLTLATTGKSAPYLRLTTLSEFNGRIWMPDRARLNDQSEGFGPAEWESDVAAEEIDTSIRVTNMSSAWLPVPYAATSVEGAAESWRLNPANRTITSRTADAAGNDYTVSSLMITPTLEQIRAVSAAPANLGDDEALLDLPEIIAATAEEVTAGASNDYDRLIAMQSWFRSAFRYSLETPVDDGFDGTGADAVAQFLEERSGYCIHFAGAFALMAQSLDMEVRIVVGYLPGTATQTPRGEDPVYSVFSDQLHSWPEVNFPGIGWVPFEPTASLGVPTAFAAATTTGGNSGSEPSLAPSAAPSATPTTQDERDRIDAGDNATAGGQQRGLAPTPAALITIGALVVLLLPALIRVMLRALRRGRARRGAAGAAWAELRATLVDVGITVSDADSPRVRGMALVRDGYADAESMRVLTDAVERANYARSNARESSNLIPALDAVLRQVRRNSDRAARVRAVLIPRSLFSSVRVSETMSAEA